MKANYGIVTFLILLLLPPVSLATQNECNSEMPANCLNGVGPAVTNPDSIRMTASQLGKQTNKQAGKQDDNIAFFGNQQLSGRSAGDAFAGWSIWGSYNRNHFDADLPINSTVQPVASYDGEQDSVLIGADRFYGDNLLFGLALGYESTDTATAYNGGDNEVEGFTVAPYIAYLFNDTFSADITAGFTNLDYDTDRIDNVSGGTITGEFDSDRWFTAANLNAVRSFGQVIIGGRIGLLYTEEEQDGYTETGPNTARTIEERNIDLFQFVGGFDIAYSAGQVEPFFSAHYFNDLSRDDGEDAGGLPGNIGATQPDDDDEFQLGLGVRYFGNNFSGALEWNKVINRNKFDSNSILLTFRLDL